MGNFDFLLVRDSDSDSSDGRPQRVSPPNGSITAAGPEEVSPMNGEATADAGSVAEAATAAAQASTDAAKATTTTTTTAAEAAVAPPPHASADSSPASAASAPSPASAAAEKPAAASAASTHGEDDIHMHVDTSEDEHSAHTARTATSAATGADAEEDTESYSYSESDSGSYSETPSDEDSAHATDGSPEEAQVAPSQVAAGVSSAEPRADADSPSLASSKGSHADGAVFPGGTPDDNTSGGGFSDELSPSNLHADRSSETCQGPSPHGEVTIHAARPLRVGTAADGDDHAVHDTPSPNQADALNAFGSDPNAASTGAQAAPGARAAKPKKSMFSCLSCCGGKKDAESDAEEDARRIVVEPEVHRAATARTGSHPSPAASVHSEPVPVSAADPEAASPHAEDSIHQSNASAAGDARPETHADAKSGGEGEKGDKDGENDNGEEAEDAPAFKPEDATPASRQGSPAESAAAVMKDGEPTPVAASDAHTEDEAHTSGQSSPSETPVPEAQDAASPSPAAESSAVFEEDHSVASSSNGFRVLEESPAEGLSPHDTHRDAASRERFTSVGPSANRVADPYAHLPLYQRRILLDQRARERREAEELAKQWKDLTFHPNLYKLTGGSGGGGGGAERRASPPAASSRSASAAHRPSFSTSPLRHRPEVDATKDFNDDWYKTRHSLFVDLDGDDDGVLTTNLGAANVQAMRGGSGRLPSRPSARLPVRRLNGPENHEPLTDMPPSKTFGRHDDGDDEDEDTAFAVSTPPRRMTKVEQNELFTRLYGHRTAASASRSATPGQSPRQSTQATPRASVASPRRQRRQTTGDEGGDDVFNRLYNLSKSPRRVPEATPEKTYSFHPQVTELARQQASASRHRSVVDRLYPGSPRKEEPPARKVEPLLSGSAATASDVEVPQKPAAGDPETRPKTRAAAPAAPAVPHDEASTSGSRTVTSTTHSDTDDDAHSSSATHTSESAADARSESSELEDGAPLPPTIRA